jgi:hypothetical protein
MQSDPALGDEKLVERVARAIRSSIQYEVEPDVRANQMTDEELATVARAALSVARREIREECARVADSFHRTKEVTRDLTGDGHITYTTTVRNLADPRMIAAAIRAMD